MRIYTYKIPFTSPFLSLNEREGIIIETKQGFGEIAPLPNFSNETLKKTLISLRKPSSNIPSIHFGLQCANLPFPSSFPAIPLCALVSDIQEAKKAIKTGFQTLKIKVKNHSINEAIDFVSHLQGFINIQLRIDVNRKWSLNEAKCFFLSVDPRGIEYVEEPLQNPHQLSELSTLPIALDETLLNDSIDSLIHLPQITAFVLKPTLLGAKLNERITLGKKLQKKLTFSSCFESAIGLLHIAHLQAKFDSQNAVGIDTHRSFQNNFLPFPVKNGMLCNELLPPIDRTWLIENVP